MKRLLAISFPLIIFISLIFNFFLFTKKPDIEKELKGNKIDENKRIKLIAEKFFDDNKKYFDINFYASINIDDAGKSKNFLECNPVIKQCIKISCLSSLDQKFTETFEKENISEEIKNELKEYYYKLKKNIDKEKQILYDYYPAKLSKIDKIYLDQIK